MKRRLVLASILSLAIIVVPAWAILVNAFYDFVKIGAPSNPPAGQARLYVDSGTNKIACLNSDGSSCNPSGGGGTLTAVANSADSITDGSVFYGPSWTDTHPTLASFNVSVNLGATTTDTTHGGIIFANPAAESNINTHAFCKAAPATPYHFIASFSRHGNSSVNVMEGIAFRESSTGKMVIFGPYQIAYPQTVAFFLTNPTTFGGVTPVNNAVDAFDGGPVFLRIGDDGANRTYDRSGDRFSWFQLGIEGSGANMTANQICIFLNGGPSDAHYFDLETTSP
jgi:hypothetical protein